MGIEKEGSGQPPADIDAGKWQRNLEYYKDLSREDLIEHIIHLSEAYIELPKLLREGSGHECAARKGLRRLIVGLDRLSIWTPSTRYPSAEDQCKEMAEIARAALAQPCPSGMTREQAEKIADAALCNPSHVYNRHWLPESYRELRDSVADALQKVAGSEDTRLLDWLENSKSCYIKTQDGFFTKDVRKALRAAIESGKERG